METSKVYAIIAILAILLIVMSELPASDCTGLRKAWRAYSYAIHNFIITTIKDPSQSLPGEVIMEARNLAGVIQHTRSVDVTGFLIKHAELIRDIIRLRQTPDSGNAMSRWLDNADSLAEKLDIDLRLMNDYAKSTYGEVSDIGFAMMMRYADQIASSICRNRKSGYFQRDLAQALVLALAIHWAIN